MSESPDPPNTTGTDRWTKGEATPGEDPRDIESEARDPDNGERLMQTRHLTHADEVIPSDETMGTSSDAERPAPRMRED